MSIENTGEVLEKIKIPQKILKQVGQAIKKFNMIEEGDHILLGLSGGKDSTLLAHILKHLQKHSPVKFTFQAVTILYGMGEDFSEQKAHFDAYDIPHEFIETEVFDLAKTKMNEASSFCSFFSRMRRGHLSGAAKTFKCNKIALGHHLDDAVESLFMSMMYNGVLRSMPPKYTAENGDIMIRPLAYVRETLIAKTGIENKIPAAGDEMCPGMIMPGAKMPHVRYETKEWLKMLEEKNPHMFDSMRKALGNIDIESLYLAE
ncbi:TPA: tRNA 2-thiocytidine biosynthesis protein TtcA [Candidatus Peregrinibacteria bacterium]|nr:tRNA 2-thiocytidine biosynthesis protein TtcA [Candidatus Peregrinibacteria bacterium]HIQ57689.1 tRNA 2-thiocytidine biosynthesis protein TtcA [Candidatus Gracilibacteria bacterium]